MCERSSPTCSRRCTRRRASALPRSRSACRSACWSSTCRSRTEEDGEPVRDPRVFINPEILEHSDQDVPYTEGCLSVPDQYAEVDRPDRIRARWLDVEGKAHEEEIDGPARDLPAARDGPSERRAVHRPPVPPEARHDPEEARQAAERTAEGGLMGRATRPFHAHIYYSAEERPAAEAPARRFRCRPARDPVRRPDDRPRRRPASNPAV